MRPTPRSDDQDFLDALLDEALRRVEEGCALVVDELAAERPDLRPQVEEIVRLARETSVGGGRSMPHLSGYSNLTELGRGGMGTVYLARQDRLAGRLVALKVLPVSAGLSPRSQERFIREVEALGRLRHPHVITIFDVMQADGVLAYAMEWIDGQSLAEWIEERAEERRSQGPKERRGEEHRNRHNQASTGSEAGARSTAGTEAGRYKSVAGGYGTVAFICRLGVAIGRALGAVHRAGLLHRDVKPSNILIRRDGTPVLSDFGLVRVTDTTLTEPGMFAGTPAYSPPEQLRGESGRIDARSDVYALGVTLYHALALRPPFRADRLAEVLSAADAGRFTRLRRIDPRIPADLETIVAKAMEADPARRYQSADELADDLERLLSFQPIKARPAGLATRAVKLMRRNRRSVFFAVAASIVTFTLAAAAAVYLFVVPGWVRGHVREARLELLAPVWANTIFSSEFWGVSQAGWHGARAARDSMKKALGHYDAALRLAPFDATIRTEREVVENAYEAGAALNGETAAEGQAGSALRRSRFAAPLDPRSAGLQAYLEGDIEAALRAWGEYERSRGLGTEPDPLVEAALGILHLSRRQPARAYPRLRTACQVFPDVGFLTTYLADAAIRCGDLDDAERFLSAAAGMPRPDPLGGPTRVRAGLLAARGRDAEAEALYRSAAQSEPLMLDLADFLESRGRCDEALEQYEKVARSAVGGAARRSFVSAMDRWWARQSPRERTTLIRGALDADPRASDSLARRLRLYEESRPRGASKRPSRLVPTASHDAVFPGRIAGAWSIFDFCSALYETIFSPPLQRADLTVLATKLEVQNMSLWHRTVSQPRLSKELSFAAQRWSVLRPAARCGELIALVFLGALGAHTANAQCTSPPCFQGLGDLPGGNYYSVAYTISTDGTTVGGTSATADSGTSGEAFLWRAATGMVYLGDLPGHFNHGVVNGLSADGTIAVGNSSSGNGNFDAYDFNEAFRWTQSEGMVALGDVPGGHFLSSVYGISDDGTIIGGWVTDGFCCNSWRKASTSSDGAWTVRAPSGDTIFTAVSRNGQWFAGYTHFCCGSDSHILRWSESTGVEDLGTLPAGIYTYSRSVSNDGAVVGFGDISSVQHALLWTSTGGMQPLDDLPGGGGDHSAHAISADGRLIVGYGTTAVGLEAAMWDESLTVQRLADVLTANGVVIPSGWTLTEANSITVNGNVISLCGTGTNPQGDTEGWIARYVCQLRVINDPEQQPPQRKYVNPGENLQIPTLNPGGGAQWRKDGVNLVNGPTGYGSEIFGAETDILLIQNTQPQDAGAYDLVLSNQCGSVHTRECLVVVGGVPCDVNCDGTVNPFDIQPFLGLLWEANPPCVPWAGDANFDGTVNPFDINAFVACL